MHSIPMSIVQWREPGGVSYDVYRTSQGRIAVRRGGEDSGLLVVDSVDHLAAHVPAELLTLVAQRLAV